MTPSLNPGNRVRLRILGIELQPTKSKRAIKAELLVDGKVANSLASIEGGQPLKWDKLIICDTHMNSRIELAVYERQFRVYSRYGSETCLVSEMMGLSTKLLKINGMQYTAEIKVLDQAQAEESFAKSRKKLEEIEGSNTAVRLKATQRMFKSMLEFGGAVAELNPIAKTVLAVCTRAWERVEEQQKSGEVLEDLAGRLIGMAPLVDEVKKHAQLEPLRQNIEEFLYLIEDVSIFVLERNTMGFVVRVLKSVVDSGDRDRVDELSKSFERISSDFEKGIGVQTMSMVTTAHEAELLKRLNPVEPSGHDPSKACQEGTRLKVLSDIDNWIQDPNPSSNFMWIYGQAGIGKSTISASICNRLLDPERRAPIVSFFCKRDDPLRRDPLRLINSVAHGLAYRYPPYGKLVAKAIEADPEVCTSHLGVRYGGLLKAPLCELENTSLPPVHIVLIDAMDECGTNETRRQLLKCLRDLSLLVPWLKFIVTSRPNSDISNFFDRLDDPPVSRFNIQDYPAAQDIEKYIRVTVADVATEDEWPAEDIDRLCVKAGELFIWAATACKFVINDAIDSHGRLKKLIDAAGPTLGLEELDLIYSIIIKDGIADQGTDNISILQRCIGAIVTISMKQPVPIEVLCELMREQVKPVVLRKIVGRLGAVLYVDGQLKGAIRVLHPSFADYVVNQQRSGDYWVDPVRRNAELSIGCISTMKRELCFNVCELETSHLLNSEVLDLDARIDAKISGQLAYSCIYWIDHLVEGNNMGADAEFAQVIDGPRLLYWLEVLSVLERVEVAVQGLRELSEWLKSHQHNLVDYVWDAYRFVFAFSDPIMASVPHIYLSTLSFSPKQSEVSRRLLPLFTSIAPVVEGGDETWPKWLRTTSLPAKLVSMSTSRDSQRFVTACQNWNEPGDILVFDVRTGGLVKAIKTSSSHRSEFIAISPDGTLVASVSRNAEVLLWEADTGAMVHIFQAQGTGYNDVKACSFSPDGATLRMLVEISEDSAQNLTIIETCPKETISTPLPHLNNTRISAAAFSSDGACLALGFSHDQTVSLITSWSETIEETSLKFQFEGSPYKIVFSPNSRTLIAVGLQAYVSRAAIQIWDFAKGACLQEFGTGHNHEYSFAFSPDGTQIITTGFRGIRIFDLQTDDRPRLRFIEGFDRARLVAFSLEGTYIFCGFSSQISIWDASQVNLKHERNEDGYLHYQYRGNPKHVLSVSLSPNGTRLISGSNDGTLRIWDSQSRAPAGEPLLANSGLRLIAVSSDGSRIVALTDRSTLYAWDARTGSQLFMKPNICSFALSPDSNYLVTGAQDNQNSDSAMESWDLNTGDVIKSISVAQSIPEFIAFSQTRSHIFSYHQIPILDPSSLLDSNNATGYRTEVYIWDSTTHDVVGSWIITPGQYNVEPSRKQPQVHALSPNGDLIVSSYEKTILIHDAYTGKATTEPLVGHKGDVTRVAFSPDGARMASIAGFDDIMTWDPRSGVALERLSTEGLYVYSVAFSPDNTKLVSALGDSIFMWDITKGGRLDNPWSTEDASEWPSDTHCFPPHPTQPGWVSHDQKSLTFWLPAHYRRDFDPRFLYSISPSAIHIDFSRFAHGTAWTSVISQEALNYYDRAQA